MLKPTHSHSGGTGLEACPCHGGAGFIGSNFIHFLLGHLLKVDIVNLDALTYAGSLDNLGDLE